MPENRIEFHGGAIDLYKTCESYITRYHPRPRKRVRLFSEDFAFPVVQVANDLFGSRWGLEAGELAGVRRCLIYFTLHLKRRNYLWRVPLGYEAIFDPFPTIPLTAFSDQAALLVDSLILTVAKYRDALREYHTGLASIVFIRVLWGFQLASEWTARMVSLDPAKNDLVNVIDVADVASALPGR